SSVASGAPGCTPSPYTTLFRSGPGGDGQIPHQGGHLRLGGGVQRRDRLVADEQPRPGGQRPRDRDALPLPAGELVGVPGGEVARDRKSTRLNSSHVKISYAVFC